MNFYISLREILFNDQKTRCGGDGTGERQLSNYRHTLPWKLSPDGSQPPVTTVSRDDTHRDTHRLTTQRQRE